MGTPSSKPLENFSSHPEALVANGAVAIEDRPEPSRPPASTSARIEGRELKKSNLQLDTRSRIIF